MQLRKDVRYKLVLFSSYVCAVSRFITTTLSLNYTESYREVSSKRAIEDDYKTRQGLTLSVLI